MTQENAQALFDKLVSILRLGDWDIRFRWREPLTECAGQTKLNWVCKQAIVEIADPNTYKMDMEEFGFDYEYILLHELMHLKMSIIDRDHDDDMLGAVVHQIVDEMAKSLVMASRGNAVNA